MSRAAIAALALAICTAVAGCNAPSNNSARTSVVTALYPLTFVTERIAGERADVAELTPPGAEPHDLELTAGQVATVSDADLIVYVGEGFQPALEQALAGAEPARKLDVLAAVEPSERSGEQDPHVWLSPPLVARIAEEVADRLALLDPSARGAFRSHARDLQAELGALDDAFRRGLADCRRREIVVAHAAFGYLTTEYGLRQIPIAGLEPEAEPTPARLAAVEHEARERGVTTVFYERLGSPAVAMTLASALGADTAPLDPLESRPARGNYLTAMRTNLATLEEALDCH